MMHSMSGLPDEDFSAFSNAARTVAYNDSLFSMEHIEEAQWTLNERISDKLAPSGRREPQNSLPTGRIAIYLATGGNQRNERAAEV